MEIARAKDNYWKQYRDKSKRIRSKEEDGAWERLRRSIEVLEEHGTWIKEEDDLRRESSVYFQESVRNTMEEEEGVIIIAKEHTDTTTTNTKIKEGQGEEDSCQEKGESRRSRICLGVNQEEEKVKVQLKSSQEDTLLSKEEENLTRRGKRSLGGGEGSEG